LFAWEQPALPNLKSARTYYSLLSYFNSSWLEK